MRARPLLESAFYSGCTLCWESLSSAFRNALGLSAAPLFAQRLLLFRQHQRAHEFRIWLDLISITIRKIPVKMQKIFSFNTHQLGTLVCAKRSKLVVPLSTPRYRCRLQRPKGQFEHEFPFERAYHYPQNSEWNVYFRKPWPGGMRKRDIFFWRELTWIVLAEDMICHEKMETL